MLTHKFLNDIVRPWNELNLLLCKRNVLEPELSRITREGGLLATSLNHFVDYVVNSSDRKRIQKEREKLHLLNSNLKIIGDLADSYKHRNLSKNNRNCSLYASSIFEVQDNQFRFVRHKLYIEYKDNSKFDFMEVSMECISFFINQYNIACSYNKNILESSNDFYDAAWLVSHDEIYVKSSRIEIVKKIEDGFYKNVDHDNITYIIFDESIMNSSNIKELVSNEVKRIKNGLENC